MRRMKQRPRFYGSKTMVRRFQEIYLYFFLYCVIGWLYEVFLEVVVYRWGFSNRGVLFGPYLPIYGIGALVFLLCFGRYVQKPVKGARRWLQVGLVFLGCMTVATAIELAATYWMEYTVGSWPWQTYVDYKINFQGRIALSPSIRFGLGGLLFLYVIQPLFYKLARRIPDRLLAWLTGILALVMAVDFVFYLLK
ncbi:putative ABC transporter permease [Intestinimonas butyriciproducens]|uniref:putative ABC transporter permease n=1 Tax=Intestinimonas butyriciproducens TaxID=1297617 RepID=UPI001FAF48B5|nr:putative ABC transporter permease [Intestinimonas butyriciproducens]